MIKDLIAITVLTWAIELLGKAIAGTVGFIADAIKIPIKGLLKLVGIATAKEEKGIVTRTIDGDSIIVKTEEGNEREVRIKGIDAPEYGQDGYLEAKRKVSSLAIGQKITLHDLESDKYGRIASNVELENSQKDLAQELASSGLVYADPRGSSKEIRKLSTQAKEKSLGVWKKDGKVRQTPWDFREMM
jgi:endonuclease YncB( thermonuclease family)